MVEERECEKNELRMSVVGCRLLGLDLVPRSDVHYEQVDVDTASTMDLYNIHSQSAQNIEEATVSCGAGAGGGREERDSRQTGRERAT